MQVTPDAEGAVVTLRALGADGEPSFVVQGLHRLYINRDTTDIRFTGGKGIARLAEMPDMLLVTYRFEVQQGDTWLRLRQGDIKRLFHYQEWNGTISSNHIPLWLSIVPPLLAIMLALIFKEVIISLTAGVWLGAFLIGGFSFRNFFESLLRVVDTFLIDAITDPGHVAVILFSLLIGGMVAVISRNGGMAGVVQKLSRYAKSSQKASFITWLLGVAIFFDDYANTLIVGNTMRPVTDRFRISREKLAYLVDSTAAPVASIAFVTTWIGAELGYIGEMLPVFNIDASAYSIFIHSLQYAFYPVFTLVFMLLLIRSNRDFGPMRKAELRAREKGLVFDQQGQAGQMPLDTSLQSLEPLPGIKYRWYNAVIPIIIVVSTTVGGLLVTGWDGAVWQGGDSFFTKLSTTIGNADSYTSLIWGSSLGLLMALVMSISSRTLPMRAAMETMMEGFKTMLPAVIILVLAWSLAAVTAQLETAEFLTSVFSGNISPYRLPLITFVMAALISFSTGSSWSTMAILYPLILPTAWVLCGESGLSHEDTMHILYNVAAVVLGGSVLGDHCSPISDTTVLSSLASSCNHIDHVRTQMPYALVVGAVSAFVGGIVFLAGLPWYVDYLIGFGLLWLLVRLLGKKVPMAVLGANQEVRTDIQ